MDDLLQVRYQVIALLQAGHDVGEVAAQLHRSVQWVRKCRKRFKQFGYVGLSERSRAPNQVHNKTSCVEREAVIAARMTLEAEACSGTGLKYIGAPAVRTRLNRQGRPVLPSLPTVERILREAGLTHHKAERMENVIVYPHVHPDQPHELIQVDIVPHYLEGGQRVACFNAIDVVSRYPTGQAYPQRRATDAANFLCHVWRTLGVPRYTQVDNEGCFSGGTTHAYVLGQVVRLALNAKTELVFSPPYHPQSNGYVERFHQDYNVHVWKDTYLADMDQVTCQANRFFALFQERGDHSALEGETPRERHFRQPPTLLELDGIPTDLPLPLRPGCIHFIRKVSDTRNVQVLNVDWNVAAVPDTGVWGTLVIQTDNAWLRIYDAAPDVASRSCLATHPFPLKEKVVAWDVVSEVSPSTQSPVVQIEQSESEPEEAPVNDISASNVASLVLLAPLALLGWVGTGIDLFRRTLAYPVILANRLRG